MMSRGRDAGLTAAAVVGFALMNNKVHFMSVCCPSVAVEQRVTTRGRGGCGGGFLRGDDAMTDILARAGVQPSTSTVLLRLSVSELCG